MKTLVPTGGHRLGRAGRGGASSSSSGEGRGVGGSSGGQLDGPHPDAAASLREGLEEMFTIARLGVTGRLRRSLTNTNCISVYRSRMARQVEAA